MVTPIPHPHFVPQLYNLGYALVIGWMTAAAADGEQR